MSKLHDELIVSSPAYAKWHAWPGASALHWALFLLVAVGAAGYSLSAVDVSTPTDFTAAVTVSQSDDHIATIPAGPNYDPTHIIVQYKSTSTFADRSKIRSKNHLTFKDSLKANALNTIETLPPGTDPLHVSQLLQTQNSSAIEYAEPDYYYYPLDTIPNDPGYSQEWYLPSIHAPSGWDVSTGSSGVTIAVIDSGVQEDHPDLLGKVLPTIITGGLGGVISDTLDHSGHGTHVAGIAAAIGNNGVGVTGVSWQSKIQPYKTITDSGTSDGTRMDSSITAAADAGIRVINISLGGTWATYSDRSAVQHALSKGSVIVAAAGNNGGAINTPASVPGVVAVGAIDSSNQRTYYSSYGPALGVVAPGNSIYSTYPGSSYSYAAGTSDAAPQVAGLAADVFAVNPKLTNTQVVNLIEQNADDLGAPGWDQYYGWGKINVATTLKAAHCTLLPTPADCTTGTPADTSPPTPPSGLAASVTGTSVTLNWAASSDNVAVAGYQVFRDNIQIGSANLTSFTDTTVQATKTYIYTVKAIDTALVPNVSIASNAVTVTVPDTTAPTTPTNLSASAASPTTVNLSWTSSTDNVVVMGYNVLRGGANIGTATSTTYSDSTASPNTTYTYTITAYDNASPPNVSGGSNSANVTTPSAPDTTPPSTPTGLSATAPNSTQVNLSWVASTDNVGVVGYKILRSGIPIATSTLTTYSDTSVAAGTTYSYSVQAFDAAGKVSPASAAVSAMVPFAPDTIAPSIPTNLTATSTSSQVILNWTASTDNVAVTGYKVRRNDGQVTTAAANSYTDVNVVQGQSYSYTVAAYDLAGNASNQSASVTATVKDTTLPTPPPGLNGAAPDSTKVNLSWSASTDNVGVTGYNVYRNAAWIASTPGLSYSDTSGVPGTTYTYTVKAYDAAGNISAASGSVNVAVPAAPVATPITPPPTPTDTPPTTPTNLTATISGSSVVLSWTASTDNLGVTGYRISRGSDVFSSSGTSFTNTSVTAGVTYTYTVAAVDTAGQLSGPSNSVTITVPTSVSILSNSIANITSTTASITWTTSVASIGYFYYGTTPTALNLYISVGTSGTSHTVTLSGLIPNTLYGYSITAVAGTNRSSVKTPTATFTTLP